MTIAVDMGRKATKTNKQTKFLNLNWAVVSDKMNCINHSLYIKKKKTYTFQRDERFSYKHLGSFCVCVFLNAA